MEVTLEVDFAEIINQCLSHARLQAKALAELVAVGPDAYQEIFEVFKDSAGYEEAEEKIKSCFKLSSEAIYILMNSSLSELTNPEGYMEYYNKAAEHLAGIGECL